MEQGSRLNTVPSIILAKINQLLTLIHNLCKEIFLLPFKIIQKQWEHMRWLISFFLTANQQKFDQCWCHWERTWNRGMASEWQERRLFHSVGIGKPFWFADKC